MTLSADADDVYFREVAMPIFKADLRVHSGH